MEPPFDYFFGEHATATTIASLTRGPLTTLLEAYAQRLREQGYSSHSGETQLRLLGDFNQWLERRALTPADVVAETIEQYLRGRDESGRLRKGDAAALARLLTMLGPGASQPAAPLSALEAAVGQYQHYLRRDRGLTEATVVNYTPVVRQFLDNRFPSGNIDFQQITPEDIARFVRLQARLITSARAPLVVTALRSFLGYLHQRAIVNLDLAACVPTIATWSLSKVPRFLSQQQVQQVLDCCNRETNVGKRDYALLLLMARLGLRAGEVVALTLDDIDWDAGLVVVRGKGKRVAQMPLPIEVGAAIADYLAAARPKCPSRQVFIRVRAPLTGFASSVAICSLVDHALARAGVESIYRGSHLFRHSLATQMLNHGASLIEIGDLLRHRNPDTTRIYAKVDLVALRSIALPWPGGSR